MRAQDNDCSSGVPERRGNAVEKRNFEGMETAEEVDTSGASGKL